MVDQDASRPEAPLPPELLDWPTVEPPVGFARRVTAAFFQNDATAPGLATAPRRSRVAVFASVAAVAAAILAGSRWYRAAEPEGGAVTTHVTRTVQVGRRAIAVARPGADLKWQIDDGAARVRQNTGRVFYRVDEGGLFEVVTPGGTVTVTGTCFEVEVDSMTSHGTWKAGAAGAVLASAVVVTVYEGDVVLANDRGEVALAAGERGLADGREAPRREADTVGERTPADATGELRRQSRALEQARAEARSHEKEVEQLRRQVAALGGAPDQPEDPGDRVRRCAREGHGGDCPFLEPDDETLLEMARCATVKMDLPAFLDNLESPQMDRYAAKLGLADPEEIAGLQRAADKHYDEYNARMRELFLELGGDPMTAQAASAETMKAFIKDQLDRDLLAEIQRHVAEERAGLRPPPTDPTPMSIEEQVFRLHTELGNRFEALIAAELGPERARELRRKNDGWPGSTSVYSGTCRDEPD